MRGGGGDGVQAVRGRGRWGSGFGRLVGKGGSWGGEFAAPACFWSLSAEGAGDGGDVVVDHAEVGSEVGSGGSHGVGEEFAADLDVVTAGLSTFDEGADVFVGDGGFNEDGRNLTFNEEGDEVADVAQTGFRFGADALDAPDFDIIGAAEVTEGIVSGDEDTTRRGDGAEAGSGVVVEFGHFSLERGDAAEVEVAMGWIDGGEGFRDDGDGVGPGADVHPEVGIGLAVGLDEGDAAGGDDFLGDGDDGFATCGHAGEDRPEFTFEVKAVDEDEVGVGKEEEVASGGLVGVGIDAFADEGVDVGPVAGEVAGEVGDHAGGGDDGGSGEGGNGGEEEGEGEELGFHTLRIQSDKREVVKFGSRCRQDGEEAGRILGEGVVNKGNGCVDVAL